MESRLAAVLTVLSVACTTVAAAIVLVGPAAAIAVGAVSALALAAWLWTGSPQDAVSDAVLAPYLLSVPLLVALEAIRYMSGWVGFLATRTVPLFAPGFQMNNASWFVFFVVCPVTLLLAGGYFLSRRHRLGHYMAWWTAAWVITQGLVELTARFLGGQPVGLDSLAGAVAALALIFTGARICQRLLSEKAATIPPPAALTVRQRLVWSVLFVAATGVYGVTLMRQAGPLPVIIIVGSMLGGLTGWWFTTARRPADPSRAVPMFLILLTLFYIHVGEEALTGFNRAIASISGTPWSDDDFTLLIGLLGPVAWFFAAWSLWKRQPIGNFIYWFLIVGMILGEPTHMVLFPILAMNKFGIGYEYFSGMYTALFPMIPAILALVMIVDEHRKVQVQVAK